MLSKLKNFASYIFKKENTSKFCKAKLEALSFFFFVLFLFPFAAGAAGEGVETGFGLETTATTAGLKHGTAQTLGPAGLIGSIVGYALAMVGVIFFVLMVYGGFLWMTARGKEEQIKKAKDLLESAIIGIVIVFISYVVTRFVVGRLVSVAVPTPTPTPTPPPLPS
ncbi:MAG: hypothetical protein UX98_C0005G0027 [Parcubacteria group bacterium GW2011_GWA2_47_26]|nr:MAG: hypothetical protein UX98_C0005G0027 [Parcubacteria group bacterium GW2011_GWA2_47_26]